MRIWVFRRSQSACEDQKAWLVWMEDGGARPATIKGYRWTTDRLLGRYPKLRLAQFTEEHLTGVIEEANPASRQSRRSAFVSLFGWAYRTGRIEWNPMTRVPKYKQLPQEPVEVFTEAECKSLCKLPEPDGTLMALLLGSGIRKSEAANMSVRRVDLDHGELHVVEGAKGGHSRIVPLERNLVSRLASYFRVEGLVPSDFLWYTHPGGQKQRRHHRALVGGSMHNWWVRSVEATRIPYRNLHVTRHTYATVWRRRGLDLADVGFLLGHVDLKTTHRVYVHTKLFDVRKRMEACA